MNRWQVETLQAIADADHEARRQMREWSKADPKARAKMRAWARPLRTKPPTPPTERELRAYTRRRHERGQR